jgi:hypothetical protein
MLPEVGGLGQTALMVASARVPLRESAPVAELVAATYLAAGGVGTVVVPNSTDVQRANVSAHGPDSRVVVAGDGRELVLSPRPAWWPSAEDDTTALAYWRGAVAAVRWMAETIER